MGLLRIQANEFATTDFFKEYQKDLEMLFMDGAEGIRRSHLRSGVLFEAWRILMIPNNSKEFLGIPCDS